MLPHNLIRADFERQYRNRIQQEAENSRLLKANNRQDAPESKFPAWQFTLKKFRMLRLRDNPTG